MILALKIIGIILASLVCGAFLIATSRAIVSRKWITSAPFTNKDEIKQEAQAALEWWYHRDLVAFDQFWNVFVLRGYPDETISAHAWRASMEGRLWGKLMTGWLNLIQPDHGYKAASGDHYRATTVARILKEYLDKYEASK